jgi:hypothetical protein
MNIEIIVQGETWQLILFIKYCAVGRINGKDKAYEQNKKILISKSDGDQPWRPTCV